MKLDIDKVEITPGEPPVVAITLNNGDTSTLPLHPPVVALLNAGAWLMREYIARTFEGDLGATNVISRRIRQMNAGERAPETGTASSPAPAANA